MSAERRSSAGPFGWLVELLRPATIAGGKRPWWLGYVLAIALVVAMLLARLSTEVHFSDRPLLILFLLPIILSAYIGGLGPGLLATLATGLSVDYLLVPPTFSLAIARGADLVQWCVLLVNGFLVSVLSEALHRSSRRAEASRALHAVTLASIGEGVITTDREGRIAFLNREAERLTGWTEPEAQGQPLTAVFRIVDQSTGRPADDLAAQVLKKGQGAGLNDRSALVGRDGRQFAISASGAPIRQGEGPLQGVVIVFTDVTEHRRSEEALRRSSDLLTAIVEACPVAIVGLDSAGQVVLWSREAERIYGYTAQEVVRGEYATVPADQQEEAGRLIARALSGEVLRDVEIRRQRKDGTPVEIRFSCAPLHDREGRPSGVIYTAADITERKTMEQQLLQAQKLEAIGKLAGGIAHDFNNTLGVIVGNLDLLLSLLPEDSENAAMAETALQAAQRGAELTGALLAFARRQPLSPRITDLNALIRNMTMMLRRSLGEQITVHVSPAAELWKVRVDPGQLQAALLNLALNARDAMPQGGALTIETANVVLDAAYAAANIDVTPGDYVMMAVTDTGAGMSPEVLARAFEPFFTTKSAGRGTGLGLSMVFGFVKQSGGHIKAYSEPGHGCTMKVYLQRAESEAPAQPAEAPPALPPAGAGEIILLVEDNVGMRQTVASQLTTLGYQTIEAEGGAAALAVIEGGRSFDLLFTDIVMPGGMSGIDLIREARARRPGLKILATSGFHQAALQNGERLPGDVRVLTKPYRLVDLARSLREVLGGPAGSA